MKLNKKGYMLVEIIVSFTIVFAMLYFLMQIIINIKNINEDYYVETKLEADQLAMTKVVMDDIVGKELIKVDSSVDSEIVFEFNDGTKTKITYKDSLFKYGEVDNNKDYITDTLYVKSLDKKLSFKDAVFDNKCNVNNEYVECYDINEQDIDGGLLNIRISALTTYSDNDYGINLSLPYNNKEITIMKRYNVTYHSGEGVNSISSPSVVKCTLENNNCYVVLPDYSVNDSYEKVGWKDGSGNIFAVGTKINNIKSDISFTATAAAAPTYMFYAETPNSTGVDTTRIYECNADMKAYDDCKLLKSGVSKFNAIAASTNYMFYADTPNRPGVDTTRIYRCDVNMKSNEDCIVLKNGIQVFNALAATDKYLFYADTPKTVGVDTTKIYRCDINMKAYDECTLIKTGLLKFNSLAATDKYLFYAETPDSAGVDTTKIYRCDVNMKSSDDCIVIKNGIREFNAIAASNNYMFYAETPNKTGVNTTIIYRCDVDMKANSDCKALKNNINKFNALAVSNNYMFYAETPNSTGVDTTRIYRCDANMKAYSNCTTIKNRITELNALAATNN